MRDIHKALGPRALVIVLVYEGYTNSPRTEGFSYSPCIRGLSVKPSDRGLYVYPSPEDFKYIPMLIGLFPRWLVDPQNVLLIDWDCALYVVKMITSAVCG